MDLGASGVIIGVEILDASTRFTPNDAAVALKDHSDDSPVVYRIVEESLAEVNVTLR